jgi:hypothetical protein
MFTFWALATIGKQSAAAANTDAKVLAGKAKLEVLLIDVNFCLLMMLVAMFKQQNSARGPNGFATAR